jgi:hypothetical protein
LKAKVTQKTSKVPPKVKWVGSLSLAKIDILELLERVLGWTSSRFMAQNQLFKGWLINDKSKIRLD